MGRTTFERGTWQKLRKNGAAQLSIDWPNSITETVSERIEISNRTEEENTLIKPLLLTDFYLFIYLLKGMLSVSHLPVFSLMSAHVCTCCFGV